MGLRDEQVLSLGLVILSALIYAIISPTIGALYGIMSLLYFIMVETGLKRGVEFIRQPHNISSTIIGVIILLVIWVGISILITNVIQPAFGVSLFSISDLLNIDNPATKLFVYGIFIPAVETPFFLSAVLVFWAGILGIPILWNTKNKKMYECAILVGITAVAFHMLTIVALKQVMTIEMEALASIPYFLFLTISSLFVFKYRQLVEVMLVHIILNIGALYTTGALHG